MKVSLALFVTVTIIVGAIAANPVDNPVHSIAKRGACKTLGEHCSTADICCPHQTRLGVGFQLLHTECHVFDGFKCRLTIGFPQYREFLKLRRGVNVRNYGSRYSRYWAAVRKNHPTMESKVTSKMFFVLLTMAMYIETITANPVAVSPLHKIVKRRTCIPAGKECGINDYCCDRRRGAGFSLHHIPYACTVFYDFKCRSFLEIPQFGTLLKLHYQLNGTNYAELRNRYWKAVSHYGF